MEYLDRYLYAVGKFLPKNRREDILAELRANLLEQAEDKEAQMGRALTQAEAEDLLKQFGRPVVVAARYLPQGHLIGPTVFPFYLLALKTFLPIVFVVYAIKNAGVFINEPFNWLRLQGMLLNLPLVLIQSALWITALVAMVEFCQAKYFAKLAEDWRPSKLPPVETNSKYDGLSSVFEIILGGAFLSCLLIAPHLLRLFLGFGPRELQYIELAQVWHTVYWIWVVLFSAQWLMDIAGFFFTGWRRIRPVFGLVGQCLAAASFWLLLRSPMLFVLSDAGRSVPGKQVIIENMTRAAARGLRVTFIVVVLIVLLKAFKMSFRRIDVKHREAGSIS